MQQERWRESPADRRESEPDPGLFPAWSSWQECIGEGPEEEAQTDRRKDLIEPLPGIGPQDVHAQIEVQRRYDYRAQGQKMDRIVHDTPLSDRAGDLSVAHFTASRC